MVSILNKKTGKVLSVSPREAMINLSLAPEKYAPLDDSEYYIRDAEDVYHKVKGNQLIKTLGDTGGELADEKKAEMDLKIRAEHSGAMEFLKGLGSEALFLGLDKPMRSPQTPEEAMYEQRRQEIFGGAESAGRFVGNVLPWVAGGLAGLTRGAVKQAIKWTGKNIPVGQVYKIAGKAGQSAKNVAKKAGMGKAGQAIFQGAGIGAGASLTEGVLSGVKTGVSTYKTPKFEGSEQVRATMTEALQAGAKAGAETMGTTAGLLSVIGARIGVAKLGIKGIKKGAELAGPLGKTFASRAVNYGIYNRAGGGLKGVALSAGVSAVKKYGATGIGAVYKPVSRVTEKVNGFMSKARNSKGVKNLLESGAGIDLNMSIATVGNLLFQRNVNTLMDLSEHIESMDEWSQTTTGSEDLLSVVSEYGGTENFNQTAIQLSRMKSAVIQSMPALRRDYRGRVTYDKEAQRSFVNDINRWITPINFVNTIQRRQMTTSAYEKFMTLYPNFGSQFNVNFHQGYSEGKIKGTSASYYKHFLTSANSGVKDLLYSMLDYEEPEKMGAGSPLRTAGPKRKLPRREPTISENIQGGVA